jgi:predicted DNA-binding protein (UPF0251 family)
MSDPPELDAGEPVSADHVEQSIRPLTLEELEVFQLLVLLQKKWSHDSLERMEVAKGVLDKIIRMDGAARFELLIEQLRSALGSLIIVERAMAPWREHLPTGTQQPN